MAGFLAAGVTLIALTDKVMSTACQNKAEADKAEADKAESACDTCNAESCEGCEAKEE